MIHIYRSAPIQAAFCLNSAEVVLQVNLCMHTNSCIRNEGSDEGADKDLKENNRISNLIVDFVNFSNLKKNFTQKKI